MKLSLSATPEEVMRAVERLRGFTQDLNLSEVEAFRLTVSLEECACNVVNHALKRQPERTFEVSFSKTSTHVVIELRDRGPEFDPTQVMAPCDSAPEDRAPGGWGLQLVRRYMDEIQYARQGDQNVLTLKWKIPSKVASQPLSN